MPSEMSNIIDKIKVALGDSQAPWYGSDLVPWVADLLEEHEKLQIELKTKEFGAGEFSKNLRDYFADIANYIDHQAAENAKLNLILYHRENGLSHPDLNNEILQSRLAEVEANLKVKDELLEWAWVDCGSQDDLTGYLARLEEMNKPS